MSADPNPFTQGYECEAAVGGQFVAEVVGLEAGRYWGATERMVTVVCDSVLFSHAVKWTCRAAEVPSIGSRVLITVTPYEEDR